MNRKKASPLPSPRRRPHRGHGPWVSGSVGGKFVKKAAFSQQGHPTPGWTGCVLGHTASCHPLARLFVPWTSCFVSLCGSHPAAWQESVQRPICKCPRVRPALPGIHPRPRKSQPPCAHFLSQHLLSSVIADGPFLPLEKLALTPGLPFCPAMTSGTVPSELNNLRGLEDIRLQ